MAKLNWSFDDAYSMYYFGLIFNSKESEIDCEEVKEAFDGDFEDAVDFLVDLVYNGMGNELDTLTPLWWDEWDDYVYQGLENCLVDCQGEGQTIYWSLETEDGETLSDGNYICQYDRLIENPNPRKSFLKEENFTENHYLIGYGSRVKGQNFVFDVPDDIEIDQIKLMKDTWCHLKFKKCDDYRDIFGQETVGCRLYYKGEVLDIEDDDNCGTAGCSRLFLFKYNPEIKQWELIKHLH